MMQYYNYPYSQAQVQPQQMQIQNSGFVSVRNEAEARNYPIAYGNSVTFKDEVAPYIYTKTMGFSQLDRPVFEKYRLVKEEAETSAEVKPMTDTVVDEIKGEISAIWGEIDALKEKKSTANAKRGKDDGV